jgi:hypothetical protein
MNTTANRERFRETMRYRRRHLEAIRAYNSLAEEAALPAIR